MQTAGTHGKRRNQESQTDDVLDPCEKLKSGHHSKNTEYSTYYKSEKHEPPEFRTACTTAETCIVAEYTAYGILKRKRCARHVDISHNE